MSEIELLTREVRSLRLLLLGTRINKTAMAERLGITLGTLQSRIKRGDVPAPGRDGKWLLADVLEWESNTEAMRHAAKDER